VVAVRVGVGEDVTVPGCASVPWAVVAVASGPVTDAQPARTTRVTSASVRHIDST
jgi:hypothetical protein